MRVRSSLVAAVTATVALIGAACGSGTAPTDSATSVSPSGATGRVTVFAAASLTESFRQLGNDFEAEHPGAEVTFNFAASSALVTQITQGAPADVFASADEANMQKLIDAEALADAPVTFARNTLAVIVGKGNPKKIASVRDLTDPKLIVVIAAPQVPVGAYAAQVFHKAGITVTPRSLETDVKAVVTKVTSGEADAGVVYSTDVRSAGDKAEGVTIPDDLNTVVTYPIAVTRAAPNAAAARAFVAYVTGTRGRERMAGYGFAVG